MRSASSFDQIFGAFSGSRRDSLGGKWLLPTVSKDSSFPSASRDFCSIYIASGTHTRWLRANEKIIDHMQAADVVGLVVWTLLRTRAVLLMA